MNLVIDIGNSSTKLAIFVEGKIVASARHESPAEKPLRDFIKGKKIEKTIVSSVKDIPRSILEIIKSESGMVHILSYLSKLPFTIEYKTPETLGADRIAAVAGAYKTFPGSDTLIIDAGTAITYDFIEGEEYKGGNISPGIDLRFRALHNYTGRLPFVSRQYEYVFPGSNTTEAIIAGVVSGVIFEINEYIRTFVEKHRYPFVILTGGDSDFIKDKIDGKINYLPDLVADGLNFILEYNAK